MEQGICLILSNIDFHTADLIRRGGDKDEELLQNTFTSLGFKVITKRNKTSTKMLSIIYKTVLNETKKEHNTFALCLLSHGNAPFLIMGVDGNSLNIWTDMLPAITGQHCPQLSQKPKLIFVQACQGSAIINSAFPHHQHKMEFDSYDMGSHSRKTESQFANVLMMVAAPPYYLSLRHPKSGSPFVKIFCTMLTRYCAIKDLEEIFKLINQAAAEKDYTLLSKLTNAQELVKVQPTLHSTLTKKFYLYPQRNSHEWIKPEFSSAPKPCNFSDETTVFPHQIEVCYASNGRIVLAALEDKSARQNNLFHFILFVRRSDSSWMQRCVELTLTEADTCHNGRHFTAQLVGLLPGSTLLHVSNLDTGLSNVFMVSWMQQLTDSDTMIKARVSSSYCRLLVNGVLHLDCSKALLWAPCQQDGLLRYLDVPLLETSMEWRHSALRAPSMISTAQTTLAVLDVELHNIIVLHRDAASGYPLLYRVSNLKSEMINSFAILSDGKLILTEMQSNRMTFWYLSSGDDDTAKQKMCHVSSLSGKPKMVQLLQVHTDSTETTLIRVTEEAERDKVACVCSVYWANRMPLQENMTESPQMSIIEEVIDKKIVHCATNNTH